VTGRFLSVDPAGESAKPARPQSWNRYSYGLNNPVKYVDPDGQVVETAWDVLSIGVGLVSLYQNVRDGNIKEALIDVGGIAVDGLAAAIPVVPGGAGAAIKAARLADKANDGAKVVQASNRLNDFRTTFDNIFSENLSRETAEAVARERAGEVVARKANGEAYNHIEKFESARQGVVSRLISLGNIASDQRVSDSERAYALFLLKTYSKKLDEIERVAKAAPAP
jgi:hypothetical protein